MLNTRTTKRLALPLFLAAIAIAGIGCPYPLSIYDLPGLETGGESPYDGHETGGESPYDDLEYEQGYTEGFARDDWYWQGFDDSYDTIDAGPLYYQGSEIPYAESSPYDEGFWDGVWYAYNDGYFVCYDYAFTIGFSDGYDAAYYPDYLAFLAVDEHTEYYDGGWSDGYADGFSEGRIFGANDYESAIGFDWLDAMTDYRSGTDLYFEELLLGTGEYGPVYLYEYGLDPAAVKTAGRTLRRGPAFGAIRTGIAAKDGQAQELSYRPLTEEIRGDLDKKPDTVSRGGRALTIETTWLERIEAYNNALETGAKSVNERGAHRRP